MSKIDDLINKLCPDGVEYKKTKELKNTSFWLMPATPHYISEGIPYITSKNIRDGKINFEDVNYISQEDYISISANRKIEKNDLLVTMIGTIGETAFVEDSIDFYGQNMYLIRLDENKINRKFYNYYLTSPRIKNSLVSRKNTSSQGYIKAGSLEELSVPVPPLEVQCEIVHILDDFTLLSALLSAELKARQKQYEYYLHHLLDIKEGKEMTIGDIYDFKYGTGNTIPEGGGEYPVYGSNGMVGYYSEYNSEDAPVIGHIGAYAGIVNWAKGKHFVTYNGVICKHKNMNVDKRYAYYILLTQDFIGEQKGAQPFVSYDALKKPIVKIPELKEQQRIVNILDRFDKLCNDISEGLPAEIEARQKQYEYYRDKLLTFKELEVSEVQ